MKLKIFLIWSILFMNYSSNSSFIAPTLKKLCLQQKTIFTHTPSSNLAVPVYKSRADELNELIDYRVNSLHLSPKKVIRDIIDEEKINGSTPLSKLYKFRILHKLSKIQGLSKVPILSQFSTNFYPDPIDLQNGFDILKKDFNLPDAKIFISQDKNMDKPDFPDIYYNRITESIYFTKKNFSFPPSVHLADIIHELKHAQQRKELGLLEFTKRSDQAKHARQLEHDADTKAAEYIKCPLCLKVKVALLLNLPNERPRTLSGYLSSDEFMNHLSQKSLRDLCQAHQSVKNPRIWSDLDTPEKRTQLIVDDFKIGSLCSRLIK